MADQPRVLQALLCLAWRQPRADRPDWLRAEVGEGFHWLDPGRV